MESLLDLARALADPTRVRIVAALRRGELCVCELQDALRIPQSTLSTHLQSLRQTRLVRTRQEGRWVYYRLAPLLASAAKRLFPLCAAELDADPLLAADAARLSARLASRTTAGSCCPAPSARPSRPRATPRSVRSS